MSTALALHSVRRVLAALPRLVSQHAQSTPHDRKMPARGLGRVLATGLQTVRVHPGFGFRRDVQTKDARKAWLSVGTVQLTGIYRRFLFPISLRKNASAP